MTAVGDSERGQSGWDLDRYLDPPRERPAEFAHEPTWKPHFSKVVAYVYLSRMARAEQIYDRFAGNFGTLRNCNRHLKQLVDFFKLLVRVKPRGASVNFPNVYAATDRGRQHVQKEFGWKVLSGKEEGQGMGFILHELYLTSFELEVWRAVQARPDLNVKGLPERRFHHKERKLAFVEAGTTRTLEPDAGFVLGQERGGQLALLQHFVEMDRGTTSVPTVMKKLAKYEAWVQSIAGEAYLTQVYDGYGERRGAAGCRVLFVIEDAEGQDERRLVDVYTQALEVSAEVRNRLWFTTGTEINAAKERGQLPMGEAIWRRGHDAHGWIDDYRDLLTSLKGKKDQAKRKKTYLTEKIAAMPRVCLLPQPVG